MYTIDIELGAQLVIGSMASTYIGDYVCEARGYVEAITTLTTVYLFGKLPILVICKFFGDVISGNGC